MRKDKNFSWKRFLLALLFAFILLVGGTGLAALIYLQARGLLAGIVLVLYAYFSEGGRATVILFWGLVLPLLLLAFFLFTVLREKKNKKKEEAWATGIRAAVEAERAALRAQAEANAAPRFTLQPHTDAPSSLPEISSLEELCEKFRAFAAGRGLYYAPRDVRAFVAGLATSRILILKGVSGAGKTSLPYAFGQFLANPATVVPVQPMWKERADLIGYYNEFTKKYNETVLLKKLYEANQSNELYLTVLDEMNLARVEYYFAEFLSLLEIPDPEQRLLEIVPDGRKNDPKELENGALRLPENAWFVGTVNDNDAAYPISDKVYDRAIVLSLDGRAEAFEPEPCAGVHLTYSAFSALRARALEQECRADLLEKLSATDDLLWNLFRLTYGNRIRRQIREYLPVYAACGGTQEEALDQILSLKILPKLEYKDLVRAKSNVVRLISALDELFGADVLPRSKSYLAALVGAERESE